MKTADKYFELLFPPDFKYGKYTAKYYRSSDGLSGQSCEIYKGKKPLGSVYFNPIKKKWIISSLWDKVSEQELQPILAALPLPVKNKKPKSVL
jgi:hypothetical protein